MGRAGYAGKLPVRAARGLAALLSIAMTAATLLPSGEHAAAQDLPAQPASPAAAQPTVRPRKPLPPRPSSRPALPTSTRSPRV